MSKRFSVGTGIGVMAAGVAAAVVAGTTMSAVAAAPVGCGQGAAVVVAGTNAPRNTEGLPTGGVTGVAQRYRAQGYQVTYVDYPTDLWPLGPTPYDEDVAIGKAATERAVAGYQRRCPGRPVVIAGYSQGARIAGDVLSEAGNGRGENGVSAQGLSGELYSDPRRAGGSDGRGIENVLVGLIPGLTMSGPREGAFGSVPVTQYCLQGDPICDLTSPVRRPLSAIDGLVGYFTKHGYYPARMNASVHDDALGVRHRGGRVHVRLPGRVAARPGAGAARRGGSGADLRRAARTAPADHRAAVPGLAGTEHPRGTRTGGAG
ncbi:MAG: PE-PPE domain-containing protein [Gordonia sp. (in: high G+C Gram-positive bacteria)]|uniref:cutinase family protein n=1 Tax=Gordonia sp. (in: high G+C Gram-positive bacteria) TaxID=84139 RepID=UPI0039E38CE8